MGTMLKDSRDTSDMKLMKPIFVAPHSRLRGGYGNFVVPVSTSSAPLWIHLTCVGVSEKTIFKIETPTGATRACHRGLSNMTHNL